MPHAHRCLLLMPQIPPKILLLRSILAEDTPSSHFRGTPPHNITLVPVTLLRYLVSTPLSRDSAIIPVLKGVGSDWEGIFTQKGGKPSECPN
jgi:hypothetical protein